MSVQFANSRRRRRAGSAKANAALRDAHPKFRKLLNARQMDFFLSSDTPNAAELVERVFAELSEQGAFPTAHHNKRRKRHLMALLLNLYAAFAVNTKRYVAIGMGRNGYSRRSRYWPKWVSHEITRRLLSALENRKCIEITTGFRDRERSRGFVTRIRATALLTARFIRAALRPEMVSRSSDYELVRLKDSHKALINYQDDQTTEEMRERLKTLNTAVSTVFVGLHVSDEVLNGLLGRPASVNTESTCQSWVASSISALQRPRHRPRRHRITTGVDQRAV
jgi:hypothetical protein